MDFCALLLIAAILVIVLISIVGVEYDRKLRKKVEQFSADANSGKMIVYCNDRICGSTLTDDRLQEILIAGKHATIKSDAFCSHRFITQCYRAVIDWWYFDGTTIFLYVKPMDNASDTWRIKEVDNYSIECSHPVMSDCRIYLTDNARVFRVGETITLRTKVNKGKNVLWHYEYEIVN